MMYLKFIKFPLVFAFIYSYASLGRCGLVVLFLHIQRKNQNWKRSKERRKINLHFHIRIFVKDELYHFFYSQIFFLQTLLGNLIVHTLGPWHLAYEILTLFLTPFPCLSFCKVESFNVCIFRLCMCEHFHLVLRA